MYTKTYSQAHHTIIDPENNDNILFETKLATVITSSNTLPSHFLPPPNDRIYKAQYEHRLQNISTRSLFQIDKQAIHKSNLRTMADPRNSGYRPTRKSGREDFTPLEPPVPAARAKRSLRPDSLSPNSDISMVDAGHPSRRNSDIPMLDAQVVGHKSKGKHGAMPSSAGTDTEMLSDDSRCDPHYASSGLPERLRKIAINRRNGLERKTSRSLEIFSFNAWADTR